MASTEPLTPLLGRARFLEAVAKIETRVLESLRDGPYQVWLKHRQGLTSVEAVDQSLEEWARTWHLTDPWCKDWAHKTFQPWLLEGDALAWCPVSYFFDLSAIMDRYGFTFSYDDPWFPSDEPWSAYAGRVRQEFESALEGYRVCVEKIIDAEGEQIPRGSRSPEHFEWLALYQVKGMTYADIWRRFPLRDPRGAPGTSRASVVEKACKRLASVIGLTLRQH
jgi:hypothetical protein